MLSAGDLGAIAARGLVEHGCCVVEPGLTDAEFERIEAEHGFTFSDDHRAFLAEGLPVNSPYEPEEGVWHAWEQPWPDWRGGVGVREQLDWPVSGVMRAVADGFWLPTWGAREECVEVVRGLLADAPRLVPLYGHRFLPAGRGKSGHPVLSVWGTDIIVYGADLIEYVDQEFMEPRPEHPDDWAPQVTVPFWRDLVEAW